jgi:penicillin G amidase
VLVRWSPYTDTRSAVSAVFALDRAGSVAGAQQILRGYAGPPQNFIVAGVDGRIAYHLAGTVPNDPAWGRYVHPERDLRDVYTAIPFDRLPAVPPSHDAVLVSANNKMYDRGYEYRLSPMFAPPYRAYRIAALLHARRFYDTGYFTRMQLDTVSPADAEFAHDLAAYGRTHPAVLTSAHVRELASWNGSFAPNSDAATLEHSLRSAVETAAISPYLPFQAARTGALPEQVLYALQARVLEANGAKPWSKTGEVDVLHPFGPIGFPFLNGAPFPGNGDRYTIRVQTPEITQSFRAVWRVGDWDRGGLSLPAGESGEFGSPHYDDLRREWIAGALKPLPFSDRAVMHAERARLILKN